MRLQLTLCQDKVGLRSTCCVDARFTGQLQQRRPVTISAHAPYRGADGFSSLQSDTQSVFMFLEKLRSMLEFGRKNGRCSNSTVM